MKHWKKICGAALALMLSVTCVACGGTPDSGKVPDDPDKPDTPTTDVKGGTIDIFLPIDSDSETALKNVGNAYVKMMREKGVSVRVNVRSSQDPQGYNTSVDGRHYSGKHGYAILRIGQACRFYALPQFQKSV